MAKATHPLLKVKKKKKKNSYIKIFLSRAKQISTIHFFMVYKFFKLVLLLSITIANVEHIFSPIKVVNRQLYNKISYLFFERITK